ncbi:DNA-directed RNA polymerase [Pseudomonas syringae pv. actinidiae]|uniref:DNA-directed RNA polymerase n=1 Tax=Pseudomonas syringae pv. actinidiae TaxID=103796 RepID=A0A2V0QEL8_PSESF|nr:DNA-directed RNA polymerase [Pseudomonas syringae pv. actinidiae]
MRAAQVDDVVEIMRTLLIGRTKILMGRKIKAALDKKGQLSTLFGAYGSHCHRNLEVFHHRDINSVDQTGRSPGLIK